MAVVKAEAQLLKCNHDFLPEKYDNESFMIAFQQRQADSTTPILESLFINGIIELCYNEFKNRLDPADNRLRKCSIGSKRNVSVKLARFNALSLLEQFYE